MEFEKRLLQNSYWLSRVVFIKLLGGVTFTAFLVALLQNGSLIGPKGLTPADQYLQFIKEQNSNEFLRLYQTPTIFWYVSPTDWNLFLVAFVGAILSVFTIISGRSNFIIYFIQWVLYLSIINIGQTWYAFGWESQLVEQLFLASLIVPVLSWQKFPKWTPVPSVGLYANIWLLFRIMIGRSVRLYNTIPCYISASILYYTMLYQTMLCYTILFS